MKYKGCFVCRHVKGSVSCTLRVLDQFANRRHKLTIMRKLVTNQDEQPAAITIIKTSHKPSSVAYFWLSAKCFLTAAGCVVKCCVALVTPTLIIIRIKHCMNKYLKHLAWGQYINPLLVPVALWLWLVTFKINFLFPPAGHQRGCRIWLNSWIKAPSILQKISLQSFSHQPESRNKSKLTGMFPTGAAECGPKACIQKMNWPPLTSPP